jgi:hypothetical protein
MISWETVKELKMIMILNLLQYTTVHICFMLAVDVDIKIIYPLSFQLNIIGQYVVLQCMKRTDHVSLKYVSSVPYTVK